MDKWTELRTAYRLAKLGTLSQTAKDIGVHRSTVMRHIDTLEAHLQIKLFQRNDRGYLPTEAGLEIMRLGEVTDTQFTQFAHRAKHNDGPLEGTLTLTCVNEMAKLFLPAVMEFQHRHPKMKVDILGDTRRFDLEYGEADLAIRAGEKPTTLDNVVIPFVELEPTLCAHKAYIHRYGLPSQATLTQHRFLAIKERHAHLMWNEWIHNTIPADNIAITSSTQQVLNDALHSGCGLGFTTRETVDNDPDLTEIDTGQRWQVSLWILVHRDMIKFPKIREFLEILKSQQPLNLTF